MLPKSRFALIAALGSLMAAICVNAQPPEQASAELSKTGGQETGGQETGDEKTSPYVPKSKAELRKQLTPLQFKVTQNEDTEPAFRNAYWNNKRHGSYECVVCGQALFTHETKFDSGTGWPSFWNPIDAGVVGTKTDYRLFSTRTEVHCSRCEAHLGHVFDDGPPPTGKRYCMNSASLKFVPAEKK